MKGEKKTYINAGLIVQTRPSPLVPLRGTQLNNIPCIQDGFIEVFQGKIGHIGSMTDLELNNNENIEDLQGKWVFPTWVDSHTHAVFPFFRSDEFEKRLRGVSYQQIAQEGGGILNTAKKLMAYSEDDLYDISEERVKKMISKGTGAIEIKSGYGLSIEGELKILRVIKRLKNNLPIHIKSTFLGAHAIPQKFKGNKEAYLDLVTGDLLDQIVNEKLADFVDIFCETGYFNAKDTLRVLKAAKARGLLCKIHTNQFTSIGGIQMAVQEKGLSVDHLEIMTESDIDDLSKSNTIGCLLPIAPFFLNDPYPKGREMIDRGSIIALATDFNPGSAPSYDMTLAISLACIKCGLLPNEAINAATINAAFAMGLEGKVGCIHDGMTAHFIITSPLQRLSDLPYRICSEYLHKVIINGEEWNS